MQKSIDLIYVRAIGELLSTYFTDLRYIKNFQLFKRGLIPNKDFLLKKDGTFRSFINEYRVARNIEKDKVEELISLIYELINGKNANDVDQLAYEMKKQGFTRGKLMLSLSSKILFLNNPWQIVPMDSITRQSFKPHNTDYRTYQSNILKFEIKNEKRLNNHLDRVSEYTDVIEKRYEDYVSDLEIIRKNRFIDKLLLTKGRKDYTL